MLVRIFVTCSSLITVSLLITLLFAAIRREYESYRGNQVKLPKPYLIIGMLNTILPASVLVFLWKFPNGTASIIGVNSPGIKIGYLIWFGLGVSLMLATVNWRITYTDKGFKYRTFLGNTYTYLYCNIKEIKRNHVCTIIATTKKRLIIDKHALGTEDFIRAIDIAYFNSLKNGN